MALGWDNIFQNGAQDITTIKEIIDRLDYLTFKNFYYSSKSVERQATTRGKVFATSVTAKGLICSVTNSFTQIKNF